MRLIINTGKGGVGKTSVSAVTARRAAKLGYRTIVMSTDSAHSLADSLDCKLGYEITNIAPNLDALEIDIIHEMRTRWDDIQNYITSLFVSQGLNNITADEMAILPGMEMIAFGPTIKHPHSPDERVEISTVAKTYRYVEAILKAL